MTFFMPSEAGIVSAFCVHITARYCNDFSLARSLQIWLFAVGFSQWIRNIPTEVRGFSPICAHPETNGFLVFLKRVQI